ncbi:DnaJ protein P58IPK homolog [Seminavis robusta]|uniref:DnaJ protein P58IPK homolog n=1 Tax=Seminavis robusta TaxID=568900 RepID=A0A9N8H7L8_9STRA|nr:DnaJ protein P58IPK homolog [Seminavis robusta]|eukprot:Sro143_g066810.1 DnaJ protein P58IPK homolog (630) ;mRNA; r:102687-104792
MRSTLRHVLFLLLWTATTVLSDGSDSAQGEVEVVVSFEVKLFNSAAEDRNENCAEWAEEGECKANPGFMLENCGKSCGEQSRVEVIVYQGEDAAAGAFRFAEEAGIADSEKVLEVAQKLQEELSRSAPDYKPPDELIKCGKRVCSAGKLWKRAEEWKKMDAHDSAGADLLRALLKTGIEVDFIERCTKSLQWAFEGVKRQRQREEREAIEEAKLEKRREEERAAMEEAMKRKEEYEANFVKFGQQLQQSLTQTKSSREANIAPNGEQIDSNVDELIAAVKETFVQEGPQGGNWNETLQLIKKIPMSDKSVDVFLIEARCHEMLGNHKFALSAAGRLISKATSYDPWINDSPRMIAATLGANAAMQLGLSDNALSFYQTVLKFDPEQDRARKQYRGLKKVVKLMAKAEEQIKKGYNKKASEHVNDCLSAMRGLDVDSPLFRSKIQLQQCTILSAMNKHEEALSHCDSAVELREGNEMVSAASRKEAHLARAEALVLDMDYDEAVQDYRAAFELTADDDETKRELHHKLQSTMREQELWNGGQKDGRYNEHTGYPDGRPPQRDHAKILQLPIDLEEREKDVKCSWLRKQFKKLVRKFHPDKYKGNKKRAARKFKEVKEAKEIMSSSWGCKN